uniref:DNA-directed RNA polymerase n=1 Tax=Parascaris equorum TaxID=6256 RepID=A0A914RGJ8_PAREQ
MLGTAHQLESYISEKFSHNGNFTGDTSQLSNEMTAITELDAILSELTGKSTSSVEKGMVKPMKNAVELKRSLMHAFCKGHLFKHMKRCKLCHGGNGVLRNDGGRCILIDFSGVAATRAAKMSAKFNAVNDFMEQEVEVDPNDMNEKEDDKKLLNDNSLGTLNDTAELTLHKQLAAVENGTCEKLAWRAVEVREHFRMVWKNDAALLKKLFPLFDCNDNEHCPMDVLFCEKILVPPTKFRPIRYFRGDKFENPQTVNLLLQQRIGAIFDQDLDRTSDQRSLIPGIKQILEKKQIFAKKLTFPEPASLINLPKLRKLVKNGPAKHPGANFVLRPGGFKQVLLDEKREERFAEAKRLQPANTTRLAQPVKVLRHLDRGDLMLMNPFAQTSQRIVLPHPSMLKPQKLWSGKQVQERGLGLVWVSG